MDWKKFFIVFLRNVLVTTMLAAFILGILGFLLAGTEGLINGAGWGVILGLVSVPFTGFMMVARYWGDYAGRYSAWWVKNQTEGDEQQTRD